MVSLEQEMASALRNEGSDTLFIDQPYDYKSIFLNRVFPDKTNPRFLPAIIMSDRHAYQVATRQLTKKQLIEIYDANNKVLIGKGCAVNCCEYGSLDWKKANESIESIIELADNVAVSEIIQVPTLFPIADGNYQILTGHRRFFAMIYAHGADGAAHFKVYDDKPLLQKTKQFQENASREDLPQYGKLRAFQDAILEIELWSTTRKRMGGKGLTVKETASTLGISMGAYDNYNVLTRYPVVIEAYENGNVLPFVKMKKMVLAVESEFKAETDKTLLNVADKKQINGRLAKLLNGEAADKPKPSSVSGYRFKPVSSANSLKTLLSSNVMELDTGVEWDALDWQDKNAVNKALTSVVEYLNKNNDE
ncbi:ParB/RepB/Spo0J family partition protein [Flocculibacter collagenilyticus]|uniref:ParB/RepB/Spo0J family partition protein n=1 Tax=Flocculibacter collagenilyticus TaxID=2744479 RepID=UPI0018F69D1D|nr:hypothetical protein [Flocculibacter collagenilyticus]